MTRSGSSFHPSTRLQRNNSAARMLEILIPPADRFERRKINTANLREVAEGFTIVAKWLSDFTQYSLTNKQIQRSPSQFDNISLCSLELLDPYSSAPLDLTQGAPSFPLLTADYSCRYSTLCQLEARLSSNFALVEFDCSSSFCISTWGRRKIDTIPH